MKNDVWFTSDLHLGHEYAAKVRGFSCVEEHDITIIDNINSKLNKRSKLFVLGDMYWTQKAMSYPKLAGNIELIMGNHDRYQLNRYLKVVDKVHGFKGYKNYWLSHCPIHPNEIRNKKGNIHGHQHLFGDTPQVYMPYFNVNIEMHNYHPINFDTIEEIFKDHATREK